MPVVSFMQVFWFIVSGARYLLNSLCVTVNIVFYNVSEIKTLFNFLLLFSWWWNRCHHMLLLEKQVAWAKLRRWWKLDIDPTFLMFIQDSNINPWTPGRLLVWSKMDKLSDQTVSKWLNLWLKSTGKQFTLVSIWDREVLFHWSFTYSNLRYI